MFVYQIFLRRDSPKLQGNKAYLLSYFKALGATVIQVNGCGVALAYRNSLLKQRHTGCCPTLTA